VINALRHGWLPRVVLLGFVLVAVQTTLAADMRPFGVSVQVVLAFAAAAGAASDADRGAAAGFVVGLLYDLVIGTPIGATALTMAVAGHVAGLGRRFRVEPVWWILAVFTAVGALVGEGLVPVVRLFIGEADPVGWRIAAVLPTVTVAAAMLSPVMVPAARWALSVRESELKVPGDA